MKSSLTAVLALLVTVLILLVLFTGGYALYLVSGFSAASIELPREEFWGLILSGIPLLFPAVLGLALFLLFLRLRTRPGIRPITFVFLLAASAGLLWASHLFRAEAVPEGPMGSGSYYFQPGKVYRFPGGEKVYIDESRDGEPAGLITPEQGEDGTFLEFYPEATADGQVLRLRGRGEGRGRELPLSEKTDPRGNPLLQIAGFPPDSQNPPGFFSNFTRMGLDLLIIKDEANRFVYYFSLTALAFYMVSAWGFIRASRWPLFNAVAVFFLLSGAGGLYAIFTDPLMRPLSEIISGFGRGLPLWVLALTLAGLILLLIDILFIPYKRRIAEETDE